MSWPIAVTDENDTPIYRCDEQAHADRFNKARANCKANAFPDPKWWKGKSTIDFGPGILVFEGGDICGTRSANTTWPA